MATDFESCLYTAMILTDLQKLSDTENYATTTFQERKREFMEFSEERNSLKKQQYSLNCEVWN